MTAESNTHGAHASMACLVVRPREPGDSRSVGWLLPGTTASATRGFQSRRNSDSAAIDTSAARISAAYGPQKFETANCVKAKVAPATSAAGQTSCNPFLLATTHTK